MNMDSGSVTLSTVIDDRRTAATFLKRRYMANVTPVVNQFGVLLAAELNLWDGDDFKLHRKFIEPAEVEVFLMAQGLLASPGMPIWAIA